MNRAGRVLFLLGIIIALGAGVVVYLMLTLNQPKPAEVPTTNVVIAYQNIDSRMEIVPEQVGVANWPRAIPTPIGAFQQVSSVIGKLSTSPIPQGQPISEKILIDKQDVKETHSNASLLLENGNVAVAMPINVNTDVAEAIQAGDHVDLLASFAARTTNTSGPQVVASQRLLADVLVMQVGVWPSANVKSQNSAPTANVITFQLKEQDALVLQYAQQFATAMTLVLRPTNDHEIVTLEPVTFEYVNVRFGYKLK